MGQTSQNLAVNRRPRRGPRTVTESGLILWRVVTLILLGSSAGCRERAGTEGTAPVAPPALLTANVPRAGVSGTVNTSEGNKRSKLNEPKPVSSPRYALLVFDEKRQWKVLIVEDGRTLKVDKNANGDLTDDGPPITPSDFREIGSSREGRPMWDFHYVVDSIRLPDSSRISKFRLGHWNYGQKDDGYGLSLLVNGQTQMYAGWSQIWSTSREAALPLHFYGPLHPRLLRFQEFLIGAGPRRLSIAFVHPGKVKGADTRLGIDAIPSSVIPAVQIDWPTKKGAPALRTSHLLLERCCYWEFYNSTFKVPAGAVPGIATVTVTIEGGKLPFDLLPDKLTIPVRNFVEPGDNSSARRSGASARGLSAASQR
jgi:hypothetical protein